MWVASFHGFTILIEDNYTTGSLSKLLDIITHANDTTVDGRTIGCGEELALMIGGST